MASGFTQMTQQCVRRVIAPCATQATPLFQTPAVGEYARVQRGGWVARVLLRQRGVSSQLPIACTKQRCGCACCLREVKTLPILTKLGLSNLVE